MTSLENANGVWIIAEVGVNHDGDVAIAKELIDAAADAGADAVKFQVFNPSAVAAADAGLAPYQEETGIGSQQELLEHLVLANADLEATRDHAASRGLAWFATAFDQESLRFVDSLGPVAHKIPSGEVTNLPFVRSVGALGRPVLLSTGMASWSEVDAAVSALSEAPSTTLLHCVTAYPAPIEDANLLAIPELGRRYRKRVGWSDHCAGSESAVAAVGLGAVVVERHLTLDRTRSGPDHAASSDPGEFAGYVRSIRDTYAALGRPTKGTQPSEVDNRRVARRSWHATRDLSPGMAIADRDVVALRPEDGLSPAVDVSGATVRRPIQAGRPLQAEDVELLANAELPKHPRKVCVFTGSRAEYGLMAPLLRRIQQSDLLQLQLVVSGSHLSRMHGYTIDQVRADGFHVDAEVEMLFASDTPVAVAKSVGVALLDLAVQLDRLRPDVLVVLGDRYELLAVASAALLLNIPVAHLHGGELTEGAFDDAVRHAVTKLSHLHFPAASEFAQRIVQMGELPDRVHVVGAAALDTLRSLRLRTRTELEELLETSLAGPLALVAYHPVTLPGEDPGAVMANMIEAIRSLPFGTIVTGVPNADPRHHAIREVLESAQAHDPRITLVPSIGHEAYLSLVAASDVVVGNSSSAIIEAPVLRVPSVLVGKRQDGRPRASSVIDCGTSASDVREALQRVLQPGFKESLREQTSPYDYGVSAADEIVRVLEHSDPASLLSKPFYDFGPR